MAPVTVHHPASVAELEEQLNRRLRRRAWRYTAAVSVVILAMVIGGWAIVKAQATANCHARAESRVAIQDLVHLATQGAEPSNPFVVRLENATEPGGSLGPITC
jgi:hypothetical protein